MRYHHITENVIVSTHTDIYRCDHPVYSKCSLFKRGEIGLAIIQQKFNPANKHTYWANASPDICEAIYAHPGFEDYFNSHASEPSNDIYPTVPVRKVMWALRMKPLKKERWETTFDHEYV